MRLLVITADMEKAREILESLEQINVRIDYWKLNPKVKTTFHMEDRAGSGEPDAVLLFIETEKILAKTVRSIRNLVTVPLIVYSTAPSYYQEIECIQAGADDYQGADCRMTVLRLRIQRLVQLYQGKLPGMRPCRGLLENPDAKQFYYENNSLNLTGKEYQVLYWLVHSQEEIVPKRKILYHIWEKETTQTSRALDTVIKQLRRKLSGTPVSIRTCYGRGYQLTEDEIHILEM